MEDTGTILGEPLHHDDSVNDRSEGSKLSNASQVTANLWRETFGEDFRKQGRDILSKFCFLVYFERLMIDHCIV